MAIGGASNGRPTSGRSPWVDTLASGTSWSLDPSGKPLVLTYALRSGTFDGPADYDVEKGSGWSATEAKAFRLALESWSDIANVSFKPAANPERANLQEWLSPLGGNGMLGWHETPEAGLASVIGAFDNTVKYWNAKSLAPGGYSFATLVHEIGHALGLNHPHSIDAQGDIFPGITPDADQDLGTGRLNQGIFTVMSYVSGWAEKYPYHRDLSYGWTSGPMAFDIAAVQAIYGANMGFRTGNDRYALPTSNKAGTHFSCIWDAGGNDTISAAKASKSCVIDLRDAPLTGEDAGGYVSYMAGVIGGFTIANGAVIENAIGSRRDDKITGNDASNHLQGNGGCDIIRGGGGDDRILGNGGNDRLTGGAGNDIVLGGSGNDRLAGGAGRDVLTGGSGADVFIFDSAPDSGADRITDFKSGSDRIALSDSRFALHGSMNSLFALDEMTHADQRILYDRASGGLFYDADGNGSLEAVKIAQLAPNTALTAADFIIL